MTVLTLEQWLDGPLHAGGIGLDAGGQRWLWLEAGPAVEAPGGVVERHHAALLRVPDDMPVAEITGVLDVWPAWRLVRSAALELGMFVVVAGRGRFADTVAAVCRLHGVLAVERWEEADTYEAVITRLPGRPDRVFVLEGHSTRLSGALRLCRDSGTVVVARSNVPAVDLNLYPDAHRRGLRVLIHRDAAGAAPDDAWSADLPRLRALLAQGLL